MIYLNFPCSKIGADSRLPDCWAVGMFDAPHGAVVAACMPAAVAINIKALREREPEHDSLRRYTDVAVMLTGCVQLTVVRLLSWETRWLVPELVDSAERHFGQCLHSKLANSAMLTKCTLLAMLTECILQSLLDRDGNATAEDGARWLAEMNAKMDVPGLSHW